MISYAQSNWKIMAEVMNFTTYKKQMAEASSSPIYSFSLLHSSPSISQTWHEYKWRLVRCKGLGASEWVSARPLTAAHP